MSLTSKSRVNRKEKKNQRQQTIDIERKLALFCNEFLHFAARQKLPYWGSGFRVAFFSLEEFILIMKWKALKCTSPKSSWSYKGQIKLTTNVMRVRVTINCKFPALKFILIMKWKALKCTSPKSSWSYKGQIKLTTNVMRVRVTINCKFPALKYSSPRSENVKSIAIRESRKTLNLERSIPFANTVQEKWAWTTLVLIP